MLTDELLTEYVKEWKRSIGLPPDRKDNSLDVFCFKGRFKITILDDVYGVDSSTISWLKNIYGHCYLADGRPLFVTYLYGDLHVMRPGNFEPRENELYIKIMYEAETYFALRKV